MKRKAQPSYTPNLPGELEGATVTKGVSSIHCTVRLHLEELLKRAILYIFVISKGENTITEWLRVREYN